MQIIRELQYKSGAPTAVALGYFNGVHRGHRRVIEAAVEAARRLSARACVFTFEAAADNSPAAKRGKPALMTAEQKLSAIERMGAELVVTPDFGEFCGLAPEQFFSEVLVGRLRAAALCCGEDYRFGAKAAGDTALLRQLCEREGIELITVPAELHGGEPVSTTRVIAELQKGDIVAARELLGHGFALCGIAQADEAAERQAGCCGCANAGGHPAAGDPELREQLKAFFRNKAIAAFRTVYLQPAAGFVQPAAGIYRAVANGIPASAALYPQGDSMRWEVSFREAGQAAGRPLELELCELKKPMRDYDSPETLRAALFSDSYIPLPFLAENGR